MGAAAYTKKSRPAKKNIKCRHPMRIYVWGVPFGRTEAERSRSY